MQAYILDQENYSSESKTKWERLPIPVEEAIRIYAGLKTIMLQWEDDSSTANQIILRSYNDTTYLAEQMGNVIIKKVKDSLSK